MSEDNTLHTKYRPKDLDSLLGHTTAVTRLKGMVKTGKVPGCLLFTGPASVGKTTLARALAASINGKPVEQQQSDYKELNGGDQRSIEDMRELIRISKYKPQGKKRIIVLDEAQQILSNASAAAALLLPVESAGKTDTIWIFCSMDPSKFSTGNGKAIAQRASQFVLEPHTNADLFKQGLRILKGEGMNYLDKEMLKTIVKQSDQSMRTLANLIQGVRDYHDGSDDKEITPEVITEVLKSTESADDKLVGIMLASALTGQFKKVQLSILELADPFGAINKFLWGAAYLLNSTVLEGRRHSKVWPSAAAKEAMNQLGKTGISLGKYAALAETAANMKAESATFAVGEKELMSARLYRFIVDNFKDGK